LPGTLYYLQHGEEEIKAQPKRPRAAAELEVRPGRSLDDQIAVVVAALLDDQKSEALDSMKTIVGNAISEIRGWELETEARRLINQGDSDLHEPLPRRQTCICFCRRTLNFRPHVRERRPEVDVLQGWETAITSEAHGS